MAKPYDLRFNETLAIRWKRRIVRWWTPAKWPGTTEPEPDRHDTRACAAWLGRSGERYAAWWLRRHRGMVVLDRNFRHGHHELDIIARDGRVIVFVEVRTLTSDVLQAPAATITPKKRENLHQAAKAWRDRRRYRGPWRMDIVGIVWPLAAPEPSRVDHWEKCL